jgi:MarR family transcriptional regulator for hemolysin
LREPSTTDRRVNRVLLTDAGNHLYAKVKAEADAFREELLAGIDARQLLAATELLEKLHRSIDLAP